MNAVKIVIEDDRYPFIFTAYRRKNNSYIGMMFYHRTDSNYRITCSEIDIRVSSMKQASQIFKLIDDKRTAEYKLATTPQEIARALR